MSRRTPIVTDVTEEEERAEAQRAAAAAQPTEDSLKAHLKSLSKKATTYKRQISRADNEEDKQHNQACLDYIDDLRFVLKMNQTNRNIIDRLFKIINIHKTYSEIVDAVIEKIEEGKF